MGSGHILFGSLALLLLMIGMSCRAAEADAGTLEINVRGDAAGHLVGVVVTSDHKAVPDAQVTAKLVAVSPARKVTVNTDASGAFDIDFNVLSAGVRATELDISAVKENESGHVKIPVSDLVLGLTPLPGKPSSVKTLSGQWRFLPDPPDGFWKPTFNDKSFSKIDVPSHWVMKGFDSKQWVGGYRRLIDIPSSWQGQRIKIRFDGVHTGAEVWLNGTRIGSHDGGATPFEFDLTDDTRPGEKNLLAVRVSEDTISSYLDAMSMYAHFPLAGIYRDVNIFAVPDVHVSRLHADTELDAQYKDAVLRVTVAVANESVKPVDSAKLIVRLKSPKDRSKVVASREVSLNVGALSKKENVLEIPLSAPRKWDPEHPNLYDLTASVSIQGQPAYEVSRKIGFREVSIKDSVFLLNGAPLKLKGACRHDSHPLMGRAITPDVARQDLELMKSCNMNGFRTAHYPPIEAVIDTASKIGMAVEDEAALCFVGIDWGPRPGYYPPVNWVNGNDPAHDPWYIPVILQQVAEMVERDRSQPSVIWWSICNESGWGTPMEWAKQWLRKVDPTRPVTGGGMAPVDIVCYHNPTLLKDITDSKKYGQPVLAEEALAIFQGFDENDSQIDLDPGMRDMWVVPFIPVWDEINRSPWYMGVFTWAWVDDIFLIPGYGAYGSEIGRYDHSRVEFERALYACQERGATGDPPWGVIDGWRRPRPEYWLHKKLFSPVKIEEKPVQLPDKDGIISIPVENRFDYANLNEIDAVWSIGSLSGKLECDVTPHKKGIARLRVPAGQVLTGKTLELKFMDSNGRLIDSYRLPVGSPLAAVKPSTAPAPELREERTNLGGFLTRVVGDGFELAFNKQTNGRLCRASVKGRPVLLNWPKLHILTNGDAFQDYPSSRSWQGQKVDISKSDGSINITLEGTCQDFIGGHRIEVDGTGTVKMHYKFTYQGPEIHAREIGLQMLLPQWYDTLSWKRNAEWSVYPEDHIGRPEGSARAVSKFDSAVPPKHSWSLDNSPMGCNDFRSAKRNITRASLTDTSGAGIEVESDGSQTVRACLNRSGVELNVMDYYGGTRSSFVPVVWEPSYGAGKPLSKGDVVEGTVTLRLVGP